MGIVCSTLLRTYMLKAKKERRRPWRQPIMSINERLNDLFEEWIEASKENGEAVDDTDDLNIIFTRDGILEKNFPYINVERGWMESSKRVVF